MAEMRQRTSAGLASLLSGSSSAASPAAGTPGVLSGLRRFDAYAKPLEDFRIKTVSGAAITLVASFIILTLTLSGFIDWYSVDLVPSILVDRGRKEKMNIIVNISFPHMPCYLLSIDVLDVSGENQNNLPHSMHKVRLARNGSIIEQAKGELGAISASPNATAREKTKDPKYCGSCYGAAAPPGGCCNTCDQVQQAYERSGWSFTNPDSMEQCVKEGWAKKITEQSHEACNVHGYIQVNKVQGNIHFAPGRSFQQNNMHIHDLHDYALAAAVAAPNLEDGAKALGFSFEHVIHSFSFGDDVGAIFTGPLTNVNKKPPGPFYTYQYYTKVVGTHITYMNGTTLRTNQFSVTEHERDLTPASNDATHMPTGMPGIFFHIDISPMLITYKEYRKPFTHFLTDLCAIVGGVFTVAGLFDSLLYSAGRSLQAKMEIGKQI